MITNGPVWPRFTVSTSNLDAIVCYDRGVVALVAGVPHADVHFAESIGLDAGFFLGLVGLAVTDFVKGRAYVAPPPRTPTTRGERQHAEIVEAALADRDWARAADLRREHLLEHPGDLLVVWLPVIALDRGPD